MQQLLLGSGDWDWPEWTSVDGSPHAPSTYHALVPPLPMEVLAQRWDTIMAIHFIEHLAPWKAAELLKQCYAVLKPSGMLVLEQPDIKRCARYLLGLDTPPEGAQPGQFEEWGFYGDPNHRDELMLHRWGYYPDSLKRVLESVGFQSFKITTEPAQFHRSERDFRMVAMK